VAWIGVAAAGLVLAGTDAGAWGTVDREAAPLVGAADCRRCHPAQWSSWHASWHRTMTQAAAGSAVRAPFAGEQLEYGGYRATMDRDAQGRPRIRVVSDMDGTMLLDAVVDLTVGSHRYQQYVARMDRGGGLGERWRLPVAWHLQERRWIHLNGAFVEPEGQTGDPGAWLRHLSRWNDNCIFCHNTAPAPGRDETGRFDSTVAELGIACEACHGPAGAHVARQADPFRRLLSVASDGDPSVAHPGRIDPGRESGVCGRCHGQRIGRDIAAILRDGDGFLPGTDLADVSRPIFRDSSLGGVPEGAFALRFWPDGTPRLSAYEYQGLLLSPCHEAGALGCNHCHDMHGDEPDKQPRAGRTSAGACTGCHAPPPEHGGHGSAVDCLDCHMPRITYGLLEGMISHRIHSPDPGALVGRSDQPDACTQCHVERSRAWAADVMAELGLSGSAPGPAAPEEERASRVALDLHGGDPIQRNLAAHALSSPRAVGDPARRMAWLAGALDDEYPSVRWFAWRGLRSLAGEQGRADVVEALATFDYMGPLEERVLVVRDVQDRLGPGALAEDPELLAALEARREDQAIWIGE
jgi:hypothetical protein